MVTLSRQYCRVPSSAQTYTYCCEGIEFGGGPGPGPAHEHAEEGPQGPQRPQVLVTAGFSDPRY